MTGRAAAFWARFDDAAAYAAWLHRDQVRKGGDADYRVPYVAHLFGVAALVLQYEGSDDAVIAALLHDALEDQGDDFPGGRAALKAEIERRFGTSVLALVRELTDDEVIAKPKGGEAGTPESWRARKQHYLDHLHAASADACLVSCADKLHNTRAMLADHARIGPALWQRFRTKSKADQVWYHAAIAAALRGRAPDDIVDALDTAVAALDRLDG